MKDECLRRCVISGDSTIVLPVATASFERVFSMMNYVNNKQRNKMGDKYLNNCLVTFVDGNSSVK